MVYFFTEDIVFPFTLRKVRGQLRTYISNLIRNEGKTLGEINIIFCSDEYLLDMNKQYLNHDYYTDVITFDYSEGPVVSGDIFISIDMVRSNAEEYAPSFEHELYRVIFHGVLHLCGYKDKSEDEERLMRGKENLYLALNNLNEQ
ncbi:MAG: rRNA maturation RNase YbeY [Prevotellaceae bacterium]|jgi:rRNA maturation RNase YbeY|nr:rRNA maturation RNase YbeY [Prevotellaceae bacterium]